MTPRVRLAIETTLLPWALIVLVQFPVTAGATPADRKCEQAITRVSAKDLGIPEIRLVLSTLGRRFRLSAKYLRSGKVNHLVQEVLGGRPFSGETVFKAAMREYDNDFSKAQRDAGLDPLEHGAQLPRPSRTEVLATIRYLAHNRFDITYTSLFKAKKDSAVVKAINYFLKRNDLNGRKLVDAGAQHFGDWATAVIEAGFRREDARVEQDRLTREQIKAAIQALASDDRPLHWLAFGKMREDTSDASADFLFNKTGFRITPAKVVRDGREVYGKWDLALADAGIPPENVRLTAPPRNWTDEEIIEIIRICHFEKGLDVNFNAFFDNATEEHRAVIAQVTGNQNISPRTFAKNAIRLFRKNADVSGWDQVLIAAGISPELVRSNFSWDPGKVKEGFYALALAGDLNIEVTSVKTDQEQRAAKALSTHFRFPVSGASFILAFYRYYFPKDWADLKAQALARVIAERNSQ